MTDFGNFRVVRKPTKEHRCEQCQKSIGVGVEHLSISGKFEGDFYAVREHMECHKAWNRLNYGPDMRDLNSDEGAPTLHEDEHEEEDREWMRETYPLVAERLGWTA
jgi:ssDNA-binding Zn-finger/Zn-ribbon topoisomerase 1